MNTGGSNRLALCSYARRIKPGTGPLPNCSSTAGARPYRRSRTEGDPAGHRNRNKRGVHRSHHVLALRWVGQRVCLVRVMEIAAELEKPQGLTSALPPEELDTAFAVPTSAALTLGPHARFDFNAVGAYGTHTPYDGSVPLVPVPPLCEDHRPPRPT